MTIITNIPIAKYIYAKIAELDMGNRIY